ncbi:MAG: phosphoribosylformylglycinamidine synthase [Alphaproteobacteria bacterium]|nr:phosphoribosylformylglycinamidine synthase [Alphaproteobacteria bacterium]
MIRIEVLSHDDDGRAIKIENILKNSGKTASVRIVDVYTSENPKASSHEFTTSLTNPITQKLNDFPNNFDWALEIGYLPGVTDNTGHTAQELLKLAGGENDTTCYSSRLFLIKGDLEKQDIELLATTLSNKLIQRASIKSRKEFNKDGGMDIIIPKVHLENKDISADDINLDISNEELETIGSKGIANKDGSRRGPLGMSLLYMQAVKEYFIKKGRPAKDIELETIAQTWSEHCKHTIFASPLDEIKDGIYKHYIKRATQEIRAKRGNDDICVSVFSDNAGAIIFDENWLITDKVETHNSPSALDPFGGAITGIVGVNRDCLGFGMGAKPIINRYGYCLAPVQTSQKHLPFKKENNKETEKVTIPQYYRDKNLKTPILSPETIMNGVIQGVEVGGNCSGIPTPQGFVYFDKRYVGKPLIFVGTIGLIPREINNKPSHKKQARPGDKIIMLGGRVGRDGIHGATFSSVALDEGSPATAVQIGDPITQKKFSDALIKEVRDMGLYSAITDNGAGGLSSSVGEMGEQSGGFHVELEKVPLKYPGMAPWEIWISESQERMTLAAPTENTDKIIALLAKRGVEATVIGTYTNTNRAHITYKKETIMDMDMDFLHNGIPETPLTSSFTLNDKSEPNISEPTDYAQTLKDMLGRLNICSKEFIATQYDHTVQGTAVLGSLQGSGRIYAETSITKPVFSSPKGIVLSQGLAPRYSDIDTYHMATAALDTAIRNAVAAGVDFKQLAILDNFCWCSSDEPERLGQLKRAAEAIYNLSVLYETPFISGKDSMFNDFKGFDENGDQIKISVPPTLLISSIGIIDNIKYSISLEPKAVGDFIFLLGETKDELGASEYYNMHGHLGQNVPQVDGEKNLQLYTLYGKAAREEMISSAISIGLGGLGVALAKKAIAGQLGLNIDLSNFDLRTDKLLFSESQGRILVTVSPYNIEPFKQAFEGFSDIHLIGQVTDDDVLNINNVLEAEIKVLEEAYKTPLENY